jgi:acyl-CoA dehydrogenase
MRKMLGDLKWQLSDYQLSSLKCASPAVSVHCEINHMATPTNLGCVPQMHIEFKHGSRLTVHDAHVHTPASPHDWVVHTPDVRGGVAHRRQRNIPVTAESSFMMSQTAQFESLRAAVRQIATTVAAVHAADVDSKGRFPRETIDALKVAKVLSAPVPAEFGGAGLNMAQLSALCAIVSGACGSSGMVLAMHYIQVACIARHHGDSPFFKGYLAEIVETQPLMASITSEVGTSGDTRSSICAVQREGGRFILNKKATTGSYCGHADSILVTCRREESSPKSDQALVLVRKSDAKLTQTTSWDTMGMRGTCSPGFDLESSGPEEQIMPVPYGDIAAQSMVPYSHIMWSALWWGIANDAAAKASTYVRGEARRNPGVVPQTANRLAEVSIQLQAMKHNWQAVAAEFDEIVTEPDAAEKLQSIGWALKMNNLKMGSSEAAPQIVHKALQIVGIMGYKNDSPLSLGRHYRDALSGSLMVSNDRIMGKSASMLLVFKDD